MSRLPAPLVDVLPAGWALAEAGSSANNDGRYTAGTGSNNAGDTHSVGAGGSSERTFGRSGVDARTGTQPDKSFTREPPNVLKLLSTGL